MADTDRTKFFEHIERGALESQAVRRVPTRLEGALAAGTSVPAGSTAKEKINVHAALYMRIRASLTGTAIDSRLRVFALLADEATRSAVVLGEEDPVADATEFVMDIDLRGEKWVEIEVEEEGGANAVTVSFVEVSLF